MTLKAKNIVVFGMKLIQLQTVSLLKLKLKKILQIIFKVKVIKYQNETK